MSVRKAIEVLGVVQGVGFRPFVYRLASELCLSGTVTNTAAGVSIEVQGSREHVEQFISRLPRELPPLARLTRLEALEIPCAAEDGFRILPSRAGEDPRALISPDVAVCADCLRELFDPADRRYRYPFINCTNCGPRYTIIRGIPYDRAQTSMSVFPMCAACQAEYDDPTNRRFHAQPNACWDCGPRAELWDARGRGVEVADPVAEAARMMEAGKTLAVKGLGGFHLAADALNDHAVSVLRERKRRVGKPFAVMVRDLSTAQEFCEIEPEAVALLESPERPIVLVARKPRCPVAASVAPGLAELGLFLPYTPLHHLLFAEGRVTALVMTSGNLSEEPIAIANAEAVERLAGLADFFLVHNREILVRCDDSVARAHAGHVRQLRRSRGYVPVPVTLREATPPVLAVGGELKNTLCVTKDAHAFLSQHIGELENLESYRFFEETVRQFTRILEVEPRILAYDLHPDYFSTRWAVEQPGVDRIGVQHHHAHIASCMAENHLEGKVIGIAPDGTGYGTDGHLWGGEVLIADLAGFERAAHLEYVPMPGGAAAIREPWRMAISYLVRHFGPEFRRLPIPFVRALDPRKTEILARMIEAGVNSPLTSSCGRLFDAVAALAGIRSVVTYEAQAAIELENVHRGCADAGAYPFEFSARADDGVIGTRPMFEALVEDLKRDVGAAIISRRFHNGLAEILARAAERIRDRTPLNRVCLSGGTFQNVYLLDRLCARLNSAGFEVFTHSEVPAGDGGLSLGQALVAARRFR